MWSAYANSNSACISGFVFPDDKKEKENKNAN